MGTPPSWSKAARREKVQPREFFRLLSYCAAETPLFPLSGDTGCLKVRILVAARTCTFPVAQV